MGTLLTGLLIGAMAIGVGTAIFRWRGALLKYSYGLRRQAVGQSLAKWIGATDKVVLPLLAAVLCALGVIYITYTVTQFMTGRAP